MSDENASRRRWILFLVTAIFVFPSFIFSGIYGFTNLLTDANAVAEIDGRPVTAEEFEATKRERLDQLRGMFGGNIDTAALDTPAFRAATLQALLSDLALDRAAARDHVTVGTDRLRETISSIPAFQRDGRFDYPTYTSLLAAQGMTEASFEARVRTELRRQALVDAVAGSASLPSSVQARLIAAQEEARVIREQRFRPDDFLGQVKLDDAAVRKRYDAEPAAFAIPATLKAEYVVLSLDDVARDIQLAPEQILGYYEQNRSRWTEPEQRRASHILLTVGPDGTAPDKAGARRKADELLARLKASPASFAALAREFSKDPGSAEKGGDLGFFGRNMMVKPFEDAAFALAAGDTSGVVESDFGFHIIRLTAIQPEKVKPLDEVRGEIEAEFRRQQAQKLFAERAEQFTNIVYEQPDSLQPAAERFKLEIRTVDGLTRTGGPRADAKLFTPKVLEALFADEAIERKRNTVAIEVAGGALLSARVVEHRPAGVKPFEEVADALRRRLEREEARRLARAAGEARLAELRQAPGEAGFGPPRTVSRLEPAGLSAPALQGIMHAPAGKLPAFVGANLDDGSYLVARIEAVRPAEKSDEARRAELGRSWKQVVAAAEDYELRRATMASFKARVLKSELTAAGAAEGPRPAEATDAK